MNYLLDTHTLIWFLEDDENLALKARDSISNSSNNCFISIASLWEIAVKASIGKLHLKSDFSKLKDFLAETGFEILPIEFQHLQALLNLDFYHRDPFDRIIIAQAISEGMTLISKDSHFSNYKELKLLWE
jgi:PIN domain nuclease of toxin-antitoxin system